MINPEFLQDAIGLLDDDLIISAQRARQTPRRRFAFWVAAACLTVMLLAIPLGVLIANQTETPKVPILDTTMSSSPTTTTAITTPTPITTEKPKNSILDIPGAVLFENDERFETINTGRPSVGYNYDFTNAQMQTWAKRVQEENVAVLGIVKDYTSVLVPDGKSFYRITTMEITVLEDYSDLGSETIRVVYANRYEPSGERYIPTSKYTVGEVTNRATEPNTVRSNYTVTNDMFEEALKYTEYRREDYPIAALLLLKEAKDNTFTIGKTTYDSSEYGDYVLDICFGYEPEFDAFFLNHHYLCFNFYSNLIREVFIKELSIDKGSFTLKKSYDHTDLYFMIPLFRSFRAFEFDSIFSERLFIETENSIILQSNPEYRWVVSIERVQYEITNFDLKRQSSAIEVALDLGTDFTFDLFAFDENGQYTFENIRLDIYASDGSLLCYYDFAKDGYNHTKP